MATVEVQCRFCSQTDPVKKHGTAPSGTPRYRCQDCKRIFLLDYRYKAWAPGVQEQIVTIALDGAGIRETHRQLKCITISKSLEGDNICYLTGIWVSTYAA